MTNYLVSIIIPVYNAEKYLKDCLDSIIAQTYTNWECLLIDDGSKDSSAQICDEYVSADSRFKVFHKENGGVSMARNYGISIASGSYICFLDSDDLLKPQYLETALNEISDYDLLIFGFTRINGHRDGDVLPDNRQGLNEKECERLLYDLKDDEQTSEFFCFPWNKIYRTNLLKDNNIQFPLDLSFREDEIFAYRYTPYVRKIKVIRESFYLYNEASVGLTAKKRSPQKNILFATYLIDQAHKTPINRSKTLLYCRAYIYMIDAIMESRRIKEKLDVSRQLISMHSSIDFIFDDGLLNGRQKRLLVTLLRKQSRLGLISLSYFRKAIIWYRIHFTKNSEYLKWGTIV